MRTINKILISAFSVLLFVGIVLFPFSQANESAEYKVELEKTTVFEPLRKYLVENGISNQFLDTLFSDSRIEYYPDIIVNRQKLPAYRNADHSAKSNSKFHKYNLHSFINKYSNYFDKAWEKYGVDKESICAVLYVETKFGKFIGDHYILNVWLSMAMADQEFAIDKVKEYVERKYHYLPNKKRQYIKEYYINYSRRKAGRAKKELVILLKLYQEDKINVKNLTGSYAGAFGYPQFLPSSYAKYAVDGDNNGKIDLFTFPDAILSVGNFLQNHGWSPQLYAQKKALRRYNNSERYVADVLDIARYFNQQPR